MRGSRSGEDSEDRIGVADIDDEEHGKPAVSPQPSGTAGRLRLKLS
jgi:hypothetical protein